MSHTNATMPSKRGLSAGIGAGEELTASDNFKLVFQIPAYLTLIPIILLSILFVTKTFERVKKQHRIGKNEKKKENNNKRQNEQEEEEDEEEEGEKEDFEVVKCFLLLLVIVLFCNTATQQVVEAYIYEYARCMQGKQNRLACRLN